MSGLTSTSINKEVKVAIYQPSCAQMAEWAQDVMRACECEFKDALAALKLHDWNIYHAINHIRGNDGHNANPCY